MPPQNQNDPNTQIINGQPYQAMPQTPQQPAPLPDHHFAPPPKKSKKKLIITAALTLVLIAGGTYWYLSSQEKPANKAALVAETPPKKEEPKQEQIDAALAKFITPTTGETWLAAPKKIADPGLFKDPTNGPGETTFYEVGKRGENTIVMSVTQVIGDMIYLYERTPSSAYTVILHPDSEATYNDDYDKSIKEYLKPTVQVNTTQKYDSISVPQKLSVSANYTASKLEYPGYGNLKTPDNNPANASKDQQAKVSEIKKYGASTLKKIEYTYVDTGLTSIYYVVDLPINTQIGMSFRPLAADLEGYQWIKGSASGDRIHAISRGCGGILYGTGVTRSEKVKESDLEIAAKTADGQTIYRFKDPSYPIEQKAFEEFKQYTGTDTTIPYSNVTKEEFVNQNAVLVLKDKDSQYLVYVRDQLAPNAGCAKPVVYLYPTKTTNVSVRVGADVKVSIPKYDPKQGWKNVLAQPNGNLTYQGKHYDSLFWEGPGIGQYPSITSGTVIPTSLAVTTIRAQLSQLGLNQKESDDFVTYWQDKMPSKPYTRLTWLTTSELNQLAPLNISPKPDTLIRVFLDYSGLDTPITIPTQKLDSTPRDGFTVVEWGGLSPYKLY